MYTRKKYVLSYKFKCLEKRERNVKHDVYARLAEIVTKEPTVGVVVSHWRKNTRVKARAPQGDHELCGKRTATTILIMYETGSCFSPVWNTNQGNLISTVKM